MFITGLGCKGSDSGGHTCFTNGFCDDGCSLKGVCTTSALPTPDSWSGAGALVVFGPAAPFEGVVNGDGPEEWASILDAPLRWVAHWSTVDAQSEAGLDLGAVGVVGASATANQWDSWSLELCVAGASTSATVQEGDLLVRPVTIAGQTNLVGVAAIHIQEDNIADENQAFWDSVAAAPQGAPVAVTLDTAGGCP
jgi:hypothetical protein